MLSILIPTYNEICFSLVETLREQALKVGMRFEIIVADDASPRSEVRRANEPIGDMSGCRYVQLQANVGRAAIRNRLVMEAQGDWLLFLDSDVRVVNDDFLARYWKIRERADIICGSLCVPQAVTPGCELRHVYEVAALPRRTAAWRTAHPYESFTVFNTLMHKRVMEDLSFDESCKEYGYEDALLGIMAESAGFSILHIDLPLEHLGEDPSAVFLAKTRAALRTLHHLGEPMQSRAAVSRFARNHKWLSRFALFACGMFGALMRANLLGRRPNMRVFALYKLGYYASLK